ncbi:MAG: glycosyltransferase [Clostridia bacterium]|nr:glycosyltransferase [Clostridia bacterium]
MRIVVNDIAASTGGAMTVLRDFYRCVCDNDTENEWIFLLGDRYFEETDNVKIIPMPEIKKSGLKKLLFDFCTGRTFIAALKPDVVFSMQNIITFGLKVPQIVYIHQSIPFQRVKKFSFFKRSERKLAVIQHLIGEIIKRSAAKSHRVIVQTEWMKEAVCKKCRLAADRINVVMPQVKPFSAEISADFDSTAFFYPTAPGIYKNNVAVYTASEQLEKKGLDFHITLTLPEEKSRGCVRCVGRLPYEEVVLRYHSSTLLFPSYIETFGYPLAEARQAGAIVLASDTAFSREVLEGYENAYFFDPFKPEELADLMERVVSGAIIRRAVSAAETTRQDSWAEVMDIVRRTV